MTWLEATALTPAPPVRIPFARFSWTERSLGRLVLGLVLREESLEAAPTAAAARPRVERLEVFAAPMLWV